MQVVGVVSAGSGCGECRQWVWWVQVVGVVGAGHGCGGCRRCVWSVGSVGTGSGCGVYRQWVWHNIILPCCVMVEDTVSTNP